ncbi:MAG: nitrite/sulfite reductase [Motiliproteus sp.]|nr:nitrite/sulfite reductase [Motiliproteus sp.]MCW9051206.1 nitrite/sulfite reductase [Motiliproteus sp.]
MYQYDSYDRQVVGDRVKQFKGQMARYLQNQISESEFLPLRLQNGLYVQKQAPMLRVAVPYGELSPGQLRKIAEIAERYDQGYCHVTTRQNFQFNWVELAKVPEILEQLLAVDMHAIQTSGNCIRNTTCDPMAGVAADELYDPRPYCEIIRQWSTQHPEFLFLPRKFKIAVVGAEEDRAAIRLHDVGLRLVNNDEGEVGFQIWAGGGLGRTPVMASKLREFLPQGQLLAYLKAILRVYNRYGRRDNKYKARIKILLTALGLEAFKNQVEEVFSQLKDEHQQLSPTEIDYARSFFSMPVYEAIDPFEARAVLDLQRKLQAPFDRWVKHNVHRHRVEGYAVVTLSLKSPGKAPGDISAPQLRAVADLAERFSMSEVRTTQQQNMLLPQVKQSDLYDLWIQASGQDLITPTVATPADVVCCPGADFCNLANARSLPVSAQIQQRFSDLDRLYRLGSISIRISGCINACAHHHIANIGILGVDKGGKEFYQITLGGQTGHSTNIGKVLGPALSADAIADGVHRVLEVYLQHRTDSSESFIDTYQRLGKQPFKEQVYVNNS